MIRCLGITAPFFTSGPAHVVVQVEAVVTVQPVIQIGTRDSQGAFVVAYGGFIAPDFVALAHDVASIPIIFPVGRIDCDRMVPCM